MPLTSVTPISAYIRRVVIAKWDRLAAEMIRRACAEAYPDASITVCHHAADALTACRAHDTELAIFGLGFPDMDGLDLINIVTKERTTRRLMVISGRRDHRTRQLLRKPWVNGYFDSATEPSEALMAAIQAVAQGRQYTSRMPSGPVVFGLGQPLDAIFSVTELQVFAVIGDGSDDEQAGNRLGLSSKTVHTYRQRIMRKLHVRTRTELMRWAIQSGIVRITPGGVFQPGFSEELHERSRRNTQAYSKLPPLAV